jgi:hypothetical protein
MRGGRALRLAVFIPKGSPMLALSCPFLKSATLHWVGCCVTFFMFSARRSYSSRTSCSRGESSGVERRLVDWSIVGGVRSVATRGDA